MKRIVEFIKSIYSEIKKIEWLGRKDLVKYSWMVALFLILSTSVVAILDLLFTSVRTSSTLCLSDENVIECFTNYLSNTSEEIEENIETSTGSDIEVELGETEEVPLEEINVE
jgi:preprotein translocase SecE subunit